MAQLIVRNLDDKLVQALKQRAARHGCSAEAEHREILRAALQPADRQDFKTWLTAMPDFGEDSDFDRIPMQPRDVDL
jgi:antitoxin FitA